MTKTTRKVGAREIIFRVLAGLYALVGLPFCCLYLLGGRLGAWWAWSGLLLSITFGIYAVTGRAYGRYRKPVFGSRTQQDHAPE